MKMLDGVKFTDPCAYDMITVFTPGMCKRFIVDPEDFNGNYPTWADILDQTNAYQSVQFNILAQNLTDGVILDFGNHSELREQNLMEVIGETVGYA